MRFIYILLLPFLSYSQIIVNDSNLPIIGDTVILGNSIGNYSSGSSGANQFWDFSNLNGSPDMMLGFIDPLFTPFSSSFSSSNLAVEVDSLSYYYLERSFNGLHIIGYADPFSIWPVEDVLLPTPLNYLDTINSTQILGVWDTIINPAIPSSFVGIPGPFIVDSIRYIFGNEIKFIVDGWGQVQMPNGLFDALRVFKSVYGFDSTFYRLTDTLSGQVQWLADPSGGNYTWQESNYTWRTNDINIKWSLVQMESDSIGNSYGDADFYMGNSFNNIVISPAVIDIDWSEDVSCNGDCDGKIYLDVFGSAPPFTYSWSGPNGYSSFTQNIFNLCAGTYIVSVTDSNGNTSSETITISEPLAINSIITQEPAPSNALLINVTGGVPPYNYLWSSGENTVDIYPLTNGQYSCIVTDDNGCEDISYFIVNNIPTNINESLNDKNNVIKVVDVLGRYSNIKKNKILFYINQDGVVDKKLIIE